MKVKKYILLFFVVITVGFLLGWLFPVEGPVDYIYDNYKAERMAIKLCPPQKPSAKFTEEELDYINEMLEELSKSNGEER